MSPFYQKISSCLAVALLILGASFMFAPAHAFAQTPPPSPGGQTPPSPGGPATQVTSQYPSPEQTHSLLNWIMSTIASLFAWLLGVAAVVLDWTVIYAVVGMGDFVHKLAGIGVAWRILRDIGNIVLIFGFLFAGISVIINIDLYGFGRRMLPKLLVAALLLNFSLFIAEAVIDVGNLFATEIYKQINNGSIPQPGQISDLLTAVHNEGISNRIMNVLGFQAMYRDAIATNDPGTGTLLNSNAPWFVGFMAVILFVVAAFVFFSLAFLLIARFVALIFLIILAPLGFAGLAVPRLNHLANTWWGNLFKQTITAPVLMLLLYVALAIITDGSFLLGLGVGQGAINAGGTGAWTGFAKSNPAALASFTSIFFAFLVAMGLLLAVVIAAHRMSAFGGTWATRMGGRLSFGAVSWGGRLTLGTAGNIAASRRFQAAATPPKNGKGARQYLRYALRPVVAGGKGLRSLTYDGRNTPVTGLLTRFGINAGAGAKLTPQQMAQAQYGIAPVRKYFETSNAEYAAAGRERDFRNAVLGQEAADNKIVRARNKFAANRSQQAQTELDEAEKRYKEETEKNQKTLTEGLSKMSGKQLEALSGIKQGVEALVKNLSPKQFEDLMKSDNLSGRQKDAIKDSRYRALSLNTTRAVDQNLTQPQRDKARGEVKRALNNLSKGELEALPNGLITRQVVLEELSDSQRDTIESSQIRTVEEKTAVRNSSRTGIVKTLFDTAVATNLANNMNQTDAKQNAGQTVAASAAFAGLTVPQIAKLDKDILLQPAVAAKLTTITLTELVKDHKFTPSEMKDVGMYIRSTPGADPKTVDYITIGPGSSIW